MSTLSDARALLGDAVCDALLAQAEAAPPLTAEQIAICAPLLTQRATATVPAAEKKSA